MKNIPKNFIFFFILSLLTSCTGNGSSRKDSAENQEKNKLSFDQYKKPAASFSDTIVINSMSAVFYNPDTLQLDKIKAILRNEEYETDVHNCFYQMRNARIVIKQYWPQVNIIETSRARYLLFIKKDKTKTYIDLDTQNDMCGIFLFDKEKDPQIIDMMNIDTQLYLYFKK